MNHFEEQPIFEIQPTIEQKPFENQATQSFFAKWCDINDSIRPKIVTREQWENRKTQGLLEDRPDGKKTLFIPEDLQLWEMVDVIKTIDEDTFTKNPEKAIEAKEKILTLGKTFEDTGIYLAKRLDNIDDGQEIAEALALKFYDYGQSLVQAKKPESSTDINQIISQTLTPEQTEKIDRLLAGDKLYESRSQRVEKLNINNQETKDKLYERERQKTLNQFFRVADTAFSLQKTDESTHNTFLNKIESNINKKIESPEQELNAAIFRRGLEKLVKEMEENKNSKKININKILEALGLKEEPEYKKLIDKLEISNLKTELDALRKAGDIKSISLKEREITDKIQKALTGFIYKHGANNPAEIVKNQYINCVGASMLGGSLMKEADLNYLVGCVPGHSILFLVTSDGKVEWRDMLAAKHNEFLNDTIIKGKKSNGESLTVADIASFSKNPSPEGLMFDINSPKYPKKIHRDKEGQRQYVVVFGPEYGQKIQLLNNTAIDLNKNGQYEEAIEACRQAINLNPKYSYPYNNLGNALHKLGRNKEALELYRQAISLDPSYAEPYNSLGITLFDLGRYEEAFEAYQKAISLDPENIEFYENSNQAVAELEAKKIEKKDVKNK